MNADLFDAVIEFPDNSSRVRYDSLVGLDEIKRRLVNEAHILLEPESLERWSASFHGGPLPASDALTGRPPMFLFAGDVGTGKTALAETLP